MNDKPNIKFIPPLHFFAFLVVGLLLHFNFPLPFYSYEIEQLPKDWQLPQIAGATCLAISLLLICYCVLLFRQAKTAVEPWMPTTSIVRTGPYKRTRNPIYLGYLLVAIGIGFYSEGLWFLILTPLLALSLHYFVIKKEEQYLEKKFAYDYKDYWQSTPRWL